MNIKKEWPGYAFILAVVAVLGWIIWPSVGNDRREVGGANGTLFIEHDEKNGVTCYERGTYGGYSISCVRDVVDAGCPR